MLVKGCWVSEEIMTDNENLNAVIKIYFIKFSHIEEPEIGVYSYRDIKHKFEFSLREYSITHSRVCEAWQNKTLEELLELNEIAKEDFDNMIEKINTYLFEKHTDSQWSDTKKKNSLFKQIDTFLGEINYENFTETNKIYSMLHDEDELEARKNRYLDFILKAMKAAEVNQVKDNKYLVVEKFLDTYRCYKTYMTTNEFYEKKKYLLKLKPKYKDNATEKQKKLDKQIKALKKYIDNMYDNNPDNIHYIRWFMTYLVYNSHVIHIMMIHMPLGYKTQEITKLYKKLFYMDKSTGKNDTFLYHSNFSGIVLEELYETEFEIDNNEKDIDDIKKLAKKDSCLTDEIKPFTLHVAKKIISQDKIIYSNIIDSFNYHN
jgi:hypothetical protein